MQVDAPPRKCGATYWLDGAPVVCHELTSSPRHPYCYECWEVLSFGFDDLQDFPPVDPAGNETRYCIGETRLFQLSSHQWEFLAATQSAPKRRGEAILIDVPRPRPHWAIADARTGGECFVYILRLKDRGFYVGHTGKPVAVRVEEHRMGRVVMTSQKGVETCVFEQAVTSRRLAQQLEKSMALLLTQLGFRVDSY